MESIKIKIRLTFQKLQLNPGQVRLQQLFNLLFVLLYRPNNFMHLSNAILRSLCSWLRKIDLTILFCGIDYYFQMKKVPSSPKLPAKPISPTHLQMNSPKGPLLKKGFRTQNTKIMTMNSMARDDSTTNLKLVEMPRKSTKKLNKEVKDVVNEKSIKNSKSKRELVILSEKLKKLEQKIKHIKEKERREKMSSNSQRSFSRNRENSSYLKKEPSSSRREIINVGVVSTVCKKYLINRAESHKIFKKSYSDKLEFDIPPKTKKKSQVISNSKDFDKNQKMNQGQDSHDAQIIHQFVTQVPNKHPHIQKSLPNNMYSLTPSNKSEREPSSCSSQPQNYYIDKAIKSLTRPALYLIREHLMQSLQTLQFLQGIKKPTSKDLVKKQVNFDASSYKYCVVLDLDETLIHCNETLSIPHDVKLNIRFPTGEKIQAGVNIRPFAYQFLKDLAEICEVVIFTASHQCYATVVLDHLDPNHEYISHRLFRQHCWQTQQGVYIKDLRVLKNRCLDNIILVDNAAYSYFFQLQNGVPIVPYYDDKQDKQLISLLGYLKQVIKQADQTNASLKKLNSKYFKLVEYAKFEDIGPLVEHLYTGDSLGTG